MIEYSKQILGNNQFKNLCKENLSCNSFLFESSDSVFLENFVFSFAKFLLCSSKNNFSCEDCLNCKKSNLLAHPDMKIYPVGHKMILVEDVKDLIDNAYLAPIESDKKVFIFKNFSSSNIQSQNKLLKILEEPPQNTYILLCVTNASKILQTIMSRCKKVRLNPLSNSELINYLDFSNVTEQNKQKVINFSRGNLENALNYLSNPKFLEIFDYCLIILKNLKKSTELLKYSILISKDKESFELALKVFDVFYRDLLLIRLNKVDLILNSQLINDLRQIANDYSCEGIDLIIKKIYHINEQLQFNCNFVPLCDSLLLYILEVKYLCKK